MKKCAFITKTKRKRTPACWFCLKADQKCLLIVPSCLHLFLKVHWFSTYMHLSMLGTGNPPDRFIFFFWLCLYSQDIEGKWNVNSNFTQICSKTIAPLQARAASGLTWRLCTSGRFVEIPCWETWNECHNESIIFYVMLKQSVLYEHGKHGREHKDELCKVDFLWHICMYEGCFDDSWDGEMTNVFFFFFPGFFVIITWNSPMFAKCGEKNKRQNFHCLSHHY